ncbi:MAG: BatA domain-containing protein [Ignavibacteria bacterium]
MGFLNSAVLLGLVGIVIPIIIHLLNLHKVRKVEFSSLMFLKAIDESKVKRVQIKYILLLLLRILVIVTIVLSFANPVINKKISGLDGGKNLCIVYLDNSQSMGLVQNGKSLLQSAKEKIEQLITINKNISTVKLITSSDLYLTTKLAETPLDSLRSINLTYQPFSFARILQHLSNTILSNRDFQIFDVYIFSDFAGDVFSGIDAVTMNGENSSRVRLNLILMRGEGDVRDIAIISAKLVNRFYKQGDKIDISITIRNNSKFPVNKAQLKAYLNGIVEAEQVFDLKGSENKEIILPIRPEMNGYFKCKLLLGESGDSVSINQRDSRLLTFNNSYYLTGFIPAEIPVTLITDDRGSMRYLISLFEIVNEGSPVIKYDIKSSIPPVETKKRNLLIISKREFGTDDLLNAAKYSESGGNMLVFIPQGIKQESYNSFFSKTLKAFSIENSSSVNTNLRISLINSGASLLSGVFRSQSEQNQFLLSDTLSRVFVKNNYFLKGELTNQVILGFNNNAVLFQEFQTLSNNYLVFTVSPDETTSDFPKNYLFAPVVLNSIYYLSNVNLSDNGYLIGGSTVLRCNSTSEPVSIIAGNKNIPVDSSSFIKVLNANRSNGKAVLILPNNIITEPNFYFVKNKDNSEEVFSVNVDSSESNFNVESQARIKEKISRYSFASVEYYEGFHNTDDFFSAQIFRTGLYRLLLVIAIILLIVEMFYSRKLSLQVSTTANGFEKQGSR